MDISRQLGRPSWVEVDLDNLAQNIREFKRHISPGTKLMAVVKADAYGHGAYEISRVALKEEAWGLAVASLEEGMTLRKEGIKSPLLILGPTEPGLSRLLLTSSLTPTILNWESALALDCCARGLGTRAAVHVKVDTGMGRLGIRNPRDVLNFLAGISSLKGLYLEGLYTHFATADERNKSFAQEQLRLFQELLAACRERRINIPLKHAANSAATIELPEAHLDLVRVGISLYGYYPSAEVRRDQVKLTPLLTLKSKVIFLKKVPPGTPISYGRTYITPRETLIATVPLGYGDGYPRSLSNRGFMLVRGQRAPVVGRVCMDLTMLDVGHIPSVQEGDEVVAYGCQGGEIIKLDQVAEELNTISYELLCNMSKRLPRVYLQKGVVKNVEHLFPSSFPGKGDSP